MNEQYHHGNLRDELIGGGLRMLNRDGVKSFSLRALSRELGVSHAAAYRHFSSKDELLRAILEHTSTAFEESLNRAVNGPRDIHRPLDQREMLMLLGIAYVQFFVHNPEILPLFSVLPSDDNPLYTLMGGLGGHESREHSGFELFKRTALPLHTEAAYRHLSENEFLLGFWAKVHGVATLLVTQPRLIPAAERDAAVDRLVRTPF